MTWKGNFLKWYTTKWKKEHKALQMNINKTMIKQSYGLQSFYSCIANEKRWLEEKKQHCIWRNLASKKTMLQWSIQAFVDKVTKDYKLQKSKQQKEVQSLLAMSCKSLCWHPIFHVYMLWWQVSIMNGNNTHFIIRLHVTPYLNNHPFNLTVVNKISSILFFCCVNACTFKL